jgi:hypothetical protein
MTCNGPAAKIGELVDTLCKGSTKCHDVRELVDTSRGAPGIKYTTSSISLKNEVRYVGQQNCGVSFLCFVGHLIHMKGDMLARIGLTCGPRLKTATEITHEGSGMSACCRLTNSSPEKCFKADIGQTRQVTSCNKECSELCTTRLFTSRIWKVQEKAEEAAPSSLRRKGQHSRVLVGWAGLPCILSTMHSHSHTLKVSTPAQCPDRLSF